MERIFGIPTDSMALALSIVFGVIVVITGLIALRNRVLFKMAARNIPRRRGQTALIVLGLMLATLLFSASFATGDTLTASVRAEAVRSLGRVDLVVRAEALDPTGRPGYFGAVWADRVSARLAESDAVDGVAPLLRERVPVIAPTSRQSEPQVELLGLDEGALAGFDRPTDQQGNTLSLAALASGEVYASRGVADALGVGVGGALQAYLGPAPIDLRVAGIYERGASPAGTSSLVMPLERLQALTGRVDQINAVMISGRGDTVAGARQTDTIVAELRSALDGSGLLADPVKRDALEEADLAGSSFASIFLLFAQFSVAAGVMLIFLIFVMLAAERQQELGIARAVGLQRRHLILLFAFEGALYALIAAAVGSLLGIVVGWAMVRILALAFDQFDFALTFAFNWRSVVISYTLGIVLTFLVVVISSWRISRLNIVRAIRNIPAPKVARRSWRGLALAIALAIGGALLTIGGIQGASLSSYALGISCLIIGLPLAARYIGLPERAAYTVAGLGLMIWWILPSDPLDALLPKEMNSGMEMFFLSGMMVVLGAVWAIVYNADLLMGAVIFLFGRVRGLPPVLKTAVAYPLENRLRTGMTLAMFSLVVFTLVVMGFIIDSIGGIFSDTEGLTGGFQIEVQTGYANPIRDLRAGLATADGLRPDDVVAIGGLATVPVAMRPSGTTDELVDYSMQGADVGYTDAVAYTFALMAPGYDTSRQVWQALQREPGTVVIPPSMVQTRTNVTASGAAPPFHFQGFWLEDGMLPEIFVELREPRTGEMQRLRVIGVLEQTYFGPPIVSATTLAAFVGAPVLPQTHLLRLKEGVDHTAAARAVEARFLEHGAQATVLAEMLRQQAAVNTMVNTLLQGFMGLGLVVGIAALGVIAARSVVERHHQIGMLRALGFQKEMVQLSFLVESSFIALLGILLGIGLGFGIARQAISSMGEQFVGVGFRVPWANIVVVALIAYFASLLTTFLPARQASKVYPAEALRFE